MTIDKISFGAKIPIGTCQIYNKSTKQPCSATIYEFDCKDREDIEYFKKAQGKWEYAGIVSENLSMRHYYPELYSHFNFLAMEITPNVPIGIVEYTTFDNVNYVEHLEAHQRNKYKYIGTTLLAQTAKKTLNDNLDTLVICDPVEKAIPFYVQKCGFTDGIGTPELAMGKEGMEKLIKHAEEKTKAPIIDIKI